MEIKRNALLSVFDKTEIVWFASRLRDMGFSIFASGGTAKKLVDSNVPVTDIATIVGPPILGHRVVTLSREVHAGLLAKDNPQDRVELNKLGIPFIDLVCVNFYPLGEEEQKPSATRESIIEMTDIGGPTMLRSAAKGRRVIAFDPHMYADTLEWLENGELERQVVLDAMASAAEYLVANYCLVSATAGNGQNFYVMNGAHSQRSQLPPDMRLQRFLQIASRGFRIPAFAAPSEV